MPISNTTPNYNNTSSKLSLTQIHHFITTNKIVTYPLIFILTIALGGLIAQNTFLSPTRSATVIGLGSKTITPQKAVVSFSVVYQNANRNQANTEGDRIYNNILNNLSQFNPTSIDKNTPQITGTSRNSLDNGNLVRNTNFQYTNAARVTVEDLDKVNELVSTIYQNGATEVTQVRYLPENEDKVEDELGKLAVQDAKSKAKQMAAASGARVGKVISIQEAASNSQTGTPTSGLTSTSEGLNLSQTGEIELQTAVTVTFQLY